MSCGGPQAGRGMEGGDEWGYMKLGGWPPWWDYCPYEKRKRHQSSLSPPSWDTERMCHLFTRKKVC